LEKYIVADDVQLVDAAPHYGLLSVQGPKATDVIRSLGLFNELPPLPFQSVKTADAALGEIYLMNHPRLRGDDVQSQSLEHRNGYDVFVPNTALDATAGKLADAIKAAGGRTCGWAAFETARIEAGIPRFGADMNETNIPLECGIEASAVNYNKGCYIGQEVINRIHSIGHVNRELRRLLLSDDLQSVPVKGDKLYHDGKEAGFITSAVKSPMLKANIALGYVRREAIAASAELTLQSSAGEAKAKIVSRFL